mmetsp:Transcript_31397/g.46126  ORF Transcript_31397/g.46126 Transcript_31397/m.46126 type:complete len:139 (+) Transcript_31397:68-484(+)
MFVCRFHGTVPGSLCTNVRINSGRARQFGCDAVLCPLGFYSDAGYASAGSGCKSCPDGESTMYLGSSKCRKFTQRDFLSMFFDVMGGESWPVERKRGWLEHSLSECHWAGISCDEDGIVNGLDFPINGVQLSDDFLMR